MGACLGRVGVMGSFMLRAWPMGANYAIVGGALCTWVGAVC